MKPVDVATLRAAGRATGGRLWSSRTTTREGGLGAAVMEALAADGLPPRVAHLAVRGLPIGHASRS